jgi:hypothetical protein
MPTEESLAAVAKELEEIEDAPPGSVNLAYFKASPDLTAALAAWMDNSKKQWENGLAARYVVAGRNCGNYVREGMGAGPVGFSVPNLDFIGWAALSDKVFWQRGHVTARWWLLGFPSGPGVKSK